MTEDHIPYWMAFAHSKHFSNRRKMQFLIEVVHNRTSISEALKQIKNGNKLNFHFSEKEWAGISQEVNELPNYSFISEKLMSQGIECIHVMDKSVFPSSLKSNLKRDAPIIIYAKGNLNLLRKPSIAIVGARKSGPAALDFTDTIAKESVKQGKVIVSGFAKGVDKKALDSALKYNGQSIVVLPQGIETYTSKAYYKQIIDGDVLVMSTYHPKAPWSVGLAMDRNKTIYGLAEEIYAAESNNSGGTWEGVLNGLKRGRTVFVRVPFAGERNANMELIRRGATGVDMNGEVVHNTSESILQESPSDYKGTNNEISSGTKQSEIVDQVKVLLEKTSGKGLTTYDIAQELKLDEKTKKQLSTILNKSNDLIKEKKGKFNFYHLKSQIPTTGKLFSE